MQRYRLYKCFELEMTKNEDFQVDEFIWGMDLFIYLFNKYLIFLIFV